MKILYYILLFVVLVEIQSKELDPGPHAINDGKSTQSPASRTLKRHATKEVILYLSLDEIEALKSGERTLGSFLPEFAETEKEFKYSKENDGLLRERLENINARDSIPIQEPSEENFEKVSGVSTFKQDEQQIKNEKQFQKYENNLRQQQATLQKIQLQGLDQYNQGDPEIQGEAWVAYDSNSEKGQEGSLPEEFLKNWNRLLELNRKLSEEVTQIRKSEESIQLEKPLLQLQYETKYNDQKNAIDIEKLIRERHKDELDKQSALVQAEAIANSPPILIHKEVIITKHRPVPASEPTEPDANGHNAYNLPLEILKHFPLIRGVENKENEKQKRFIVKNTVPY